MNKRCIPKVCLLQPYITPYRIKLFNVLNRLLDGGLTVLYFSKEEESRKWNLVGSAEFKEVQLKAVVRQVEYDKNAVRVSLLNLAVVLMKIRPTIVICNPSNPGKSIRILQMLLRFKMIVWSEMNDVVLRNTRPRRWLIRWFDRGVSAYIIPGKMSERYLQNTRRYKGRVYFAPNTINRNLFSCKKEHIDAVFEQDEIRFLFSGSLIELKGIGDLLEVFARLSETKGIKPYRLDIIGDGPLDKKPVKHVHYHGFVDQEECARFMKDAHVFVLPSLWDCNPLVVTEAVTAGCVTVLSDGVGNYPEYTDGNGFVFERGNADQLFGILVDILTMDRAQLKKIARRSLEIAAGVSDESSAASFEQAIQDCV